MACLDAVARADGMVAISLQQIVEELHVELVVLHDNHGLRLCRPSVKRRAISARARLAVISLGSVRASHIKKGCGLFGCGSAKTKGLVARPSSPLGQGMRVTGNEHRTEPGMNSLIVPPVARVVLPCSVNERLRSRDVARAPILAHIRIDEGTAGVQRGRDCGRPHSTEGRSTTRYRPR